MLATMSLQTLGVLALCATLVSLALFVFFHNRQAAENRRFALAALTIAGWIICISFALVAQTTDTTVSAWAARVRICEHDPLLAFVDV